MKKVMLVFGTDHVPIVSEVSRLLDDKDYYDCMSHAANHYDDGKTCGRIVNTLARRESDRHEIC